MRFIKLFKVLILTFTTINSAYAQSYRVPSQHSKLHSDLHSEQNSKNPKTENSSLINDIKEYFYPSDDFAYIITPNADHPNLAATYNISNGNILKEIVERWNGSSSFTKMSETVYKITFDDTRRAVISNQQIIKNIMGTRQKSDNLTMFVLPKDSNPVNWTESIDNEKTNCSAKFVYISFTLEDKKIYRQAVKIEKTTIVKNSPIAKEWSYWVKGLSRLATYGYLRDPNKISCIEKSFKISIIDPITEISKTEYDIKNN